MRSNGKHPLIIPKNVWALGIVSLLMDLSSEMILSILPIFLVTGLGVSVLTLGLIEGLAEGVASVIKAFSGALSDYLKKRKILVVIGYGLSTLTKPFFALASTATWIFVARFVDRLGKGIRGAPRDSLIADSTSTKIRGTAYSLRQTLDTLGAVLGPIFAIIILYLTTNNFRLVLWFAVIPAVLCIVVLIFGVKESTLKKNISRKKSYFLFENFLKITPVIWLFFLTVFILNLGHFSEAFLLLRSQEIGLKVSFIPVVFVVMNVAYAIVAVPFGHLADRGGFFILIVCGFLILVLADIILALTNSVGWMFVGIIFWGIHLGMTQGLLLAMISKLSPLELRGTSFGLFHAISGVALLTASLIAGYLWQYYYSGLIFFVSAIITLVGITTFFLWYWCYFIKIKKK
jgi:MFS family permease